MTLLELEPLSVMHEGLPLSVAAVGVEIVDLRVNPLIAKGLKKVKINPTEISKICFAIITLLKKKYHCAASLNGFAFYDHFDSSNCNITERPNRQQCEYLSQRI